MNFMGKRTVILLFILILFFVSGFFIVKNIYNNRVPRSAKLVWDFENKDYITGKNKVVIQNEGGFI